MQGIMASSNDRAVAPEPALSIGTVWLWAWALGLLEWGWVLLDTNRFAHAVFGLAPSGPLPYLALLLGRALALALLVTASFRLLRGDLAPLLVATVLTLALNLLVALRVGPFRPLLITGTVLAQILIGLAGLRRPPLRGAAPPGSIPAGQAEP